MAGRWLRGKVTEDLDSHLRRLYKLLWGICHREASQSSNPASEQTVGRHIVITGLVHGPVGKVAAADLRPSSIPSTLLREGLWPSLGRRDRPVPGGSRPVSNPVPKVQGRCCLREGHLNLSPVYSESLKNGLGTLLSIKSLS